MPLPFQSEARPKKLIKTSFPRKQTSCGFQATSHTFILFHTCCLTCAARFTMKIRCSDLHLSSGQLETCVGCHLLHIHKRIQRMRVCFKCHHCNGEYSSIRGYNTTGHCRHNFRTVIEPSVLIFSVFNYMDYFG